MPCDAATLLSDGCANFGCLSELGLLQVIAQQSAAWLLSIDSGADVSVAAILDRACDSGLNCASDLQLYQSIAQNLCALTE